MAGGAVGCLACELVSLCTKGEGINLKMKRHDSSTVGRLHQNASAKFLSQFASAKYQ